MQLKPDPVQAKHRFFQDWTNWLQNDYCDFVVIMNYRTDWNEFDLILKQIKAKNMERDVMVGISTYNQGPGQVLRQTSMQPDWVVLPGIPCFHIII